MLIELISAFGLIFIAEMGDKTQILAMAFATKYKIRQVILGVFIGSLLNHALAVLLGSNLHHVIPLNTLSIIAGFSFILFGIWNLKMDDDEEESNISKYGPVMTVSLAFFIGELGDKTQLTAIALSTDASYPLFILMGTVLGMVFTSMIGIFVGIKLGNRIDEFYIKVGASVIFLVFGYIKLFDSLDPTYLSVFNVTTFTVLVLVISYALLLPTVKLRNINRRTRFQQQALRLHDYYTNMYDELEDICLGENHCGKCGGNNCLVGYTKNILLKAQLEKDFDIDFIAENALKKDFDRSKVLESLKKTIDVLKQDFSNKKFDKIHKVRRNLEYIMYQKMIDADTYESYLIKLEKIDYKLKEMVE